MPGAAKKAVIFFGGPEDFGRKSFKQFRDGLWQKGICSYVYNINNLNDKTGCEEVVGTHCSSDVVVCCFHGTRCDEAEKIIKNLSLSVVTVNSMDIMERDICTLDDFKS